MNVRETLGRPGVCWRAKEPASESDIEQLLSFAQLPLPQEYLDLLRCCNGGVGPLALSPFWFHLYPVADCLDLFYKSQLIREQFADFIFFGTNGGGESIAFDVRSGPPWRIVMIDPIAGPESAEEIASDVIMFIEAIGVEAE